MKTGLAGHHIIHKLTPVEEMAKDSKEDKFEQFEVWLNREIEETLDDLIEAEFSAPLLNDEFRKSFAARHPDSLPGRIYFPNLLRLQGEMIKLQDWVVERNAKVLIICEGRDSAGKGGVIKIGRASCRERV